VNAALMSLDLGRNDLSTDDAHVLAAALEVNPFLTSLNLSGNGLLAFEETNESQPVEALLASKLERNAALPDDHVTVAWLVRKSALPQMRALCDAVSEKGLRDLLFEPLLPRRKP
jgi:hypothetical protein